MHLRESEKLLSSIKADIDLSLSMLDSAIVHNLEMSEIAMAKKLSNISKQDDKKLSLAEQ